MFKVNCPFSVSFSLYGCRGSGETWRGTQWRGTGRQWRKTWRRTQDAGWNEGAKLKYLEEGFVSNKPWGSGERFEIFFRYYNTSIQGIPVWKEQVEPKLQKRNQMRELQVEATTCQVYISAGEESTEDLVV